MLTSRGAVGSKTLHRTPTTVCSMLRPLPSDPHSSLRSAGVSWVRAHCRQLLFLSPLTHPSCQVILAPGWGLSLAQGAGGCLPPSPRTLFLLSTQRPSPVYCFSAPSLRVLWSPADLGCRPGSATGYLCKLRNVFNLSRPISSPVKWSWSSC